uniref:hypothetical protein n=1 Tax=Escherichia coli TaxID=562 RepID=UPI001F3C2A46|nr:hypothetical protein [Escherichia coli]
MFRSRPSGHGFINEAALHKQVQITLWREHTKILGNTGIEVLRVAKESLNDSQLVSRRLNQRIAIHGTMNT